MKNPVDLENQKGLDKYKWDSYEPNYSCPVKKTRWGVMTQHVVEALEGFVNLGNSHPMVQESEQEFHPDYYKDVQELIESYG